jgi:hypothetical protein
LRFNWFCAFKPEMLLRILKEPIWNSSLNPS